MRRRAWAAWLLAAGGLGLAVLARHLPGAQAWNLLAGLLLVAALGLAASLLPVWGRFLRLEPVGPLFQRPRPSDRWCDRCARPTSRRGACRHCGHTPASRGE